MNLSQIPEIMVDNTDRNRTSPFAFTGNRFEFRAVGSSANCASAMIAINAAVAEQLTLFKKNVDAKLAAGQDLEHAIITEVRELIKMSKPIHFDGNGYSDEWKEEAAKRGLDCETSNLKHATRLSGKLIPRKCRLRLVYLATWRSTMLFR